MTRTRILAARAVRSVLVWAAYFAVLRFAVGEGGLRGLMVLSIATVLGTGLLWSTMERSLGRLIAPQGDDLRRSVLLDGIIADLAARAKRQPPPVFLVPSIMKSTHEACALKRPAPGRVLATEGLVDLLAPDELSAVLAHELGHIWFGSRGAAVAIALWSSVTTGLLCYATGIALFGPAGRPADVVWSLPLLAVIVLGGGAVIRLVPLAIRRADEKAADRAACALGCGGECLALALWDIAAAENSPEVTARGRRFLLGKQARSWTAARQRDALRDLCRQDAVLHGAAARLVEALQTHPLVSTRTRYLIGR